MADPKIADTKPTKMTLEPGDYWFCTCGESSNQPFCDGKHKGSDFSPQKFSIETEQDVALCLCKHSKNGHCCDGTHRNLGK